MTDKQRSVRGWRCVNSWTEGLSCSLLRCSSSSLCLGRVSEPLLPVTAPAAGRHAASTSLSSPSLWSFWRVKTGGRRAEGQLEGGRGGEGWPGAEESWGSVCVHGALGSGGGVQILQGSRLTEVDKVTRCVRVFFWRCFDWSKGCFQIQLPTNVNILSRFRAINYFYKQLIAFSSKTGKYMQILASEIWYNNMTVNQISLGFGLLVHLTASPWTPGKFLIFNTIFIRTVPNTVFWASALQRELPANIHARICWHDAHTVQVQQPSSW